jgi:hypothetical protein
VQGDERDIIIFSVGYGPDEHGKFTMSMGPLTWKMGWRRLNVAITRAKNRVEIVTSVLPEQFSSAATSLGVQHLRKYLDFARRGIAALALDLDESSGDAESPFEEEVLRSIRGWGYEAVPQVGVAGLPHRHRHSTSGATRRLRAGRRVRRCHVPLVQSGTRSRPAAAAGAGGSRLAHPPDLGDGLVPGPNGPGSTST